MKRLVLDGIECALDDCCGFFAGYRFGSAFSVPKLVRERPLRFFNVDVFHDSRFVKVNRHFVVRVGNRVPVEQSIGKRVCDMEESIILSVRVYREPTVVVVRYDADYVSYARFVASRVHVFASYLIPVSVH